MRIKILLLPVILALAAGCAGLRHLQDDIAGTYYGYLPCTACPGVYYELTLGADGRYVESALYEGLSSEPVVRENRYRISKDSIIILRGTHEGEGMNQFAIRDGGRLEMLSSDGTRIETGFPERYILTRERHIPRESATTRTGFRASGDNPDWNLEIKFGNMIRFSSSSAEGFDFRAYVPDPEIIDQSTVKFHAHPYNGEFIVTISRQEYTDESAGTYPYKIHVAARRSHRESFRRFEGRGEYLGTYRLNDIWVLEKINDNPLILPESKEPPTLHIDLLSNVVSGFGGCNSFFGEAEIVNSRLVTGNITSTRMACIDTGQLEERFFGVLSGKTLDFVIEGSTLVLGDGITKLTFSRHP